MSIHPMSQFDSPVWIKNATAMTELKIVMVSYPCLKLHIKFTANNFHIKFTEPTPYLEIESKGLVHKPCDENTERDDANRNLERTRNSYWD
jgi:hypothetical protein